MTIFEEGAGFGSKDVRRDSLSSQICRLLMQKIRKDNMRPGEPAPPETQVAKELQVSRGIVREAYRTLAALGIFETNSGRRARLGELNSNSLKTTFDYATSTRQITLAHLMQLRRPLEEAAAALAAENASEADCAELRRLAGLIQDNHGGPEFASVQHDLQFHLLIATASGNPLIALLLDSLSAYIRDAMLESLRSPAEAALHRDISELHGAIARAISQHDVEQTVLLIRKHFDSSVVALQSGGVANNPMNIPAD